jgi:hypothetical protein
MAKAQGVKNFVRDFPVAGVPAVRRSQFIHQMKVIASSVLEAGQK